MKRDPEPVVSTPAPAPPGVWSWVGASYFAEGLPWSLLHQVTGEYFTSIGAKPRAVGWTALLHIPILLKVVFSPIVEGYSTLRRWMLGTQALMGVLVGGVALSAHRLALAADPTLQTSTLLWVLLFSIGVLSAIYDIACDGFYLEHLDEERQAHFSGIRVAVYRVAMLLGSFLLVFVGGAVNWLWGFGLGAVLLVVLAIVLRQVLPRGASASRPATVRPRSARLLWSTASKAYESFARQEAFWLVMAFLLFYKSADAMKFAMSSVLLDRHLGIATELRASIGVFSTIAGVLGSIWGGAWIARHGLSKAFFPITVLMVATEPLYAFMAAGAEYLALPVDPAGTSTRSLIEGGPRLLIVTLVLIIEKFCAGLAVTAQSVFIMRRCHPSHRTAHYAFATVIYSIAQILLGFASGYLFEALAPTRYYVMVSLVALPTLVMVRKIPLDQRTA